MQEELLYIERKSGAGHRGEAWIGFASRSRSKRTVYFNGLALKRHRALIRGNHVCTETQEEYWVSGPKKRGDDRHVYGGGIILVEARAHPAYLELRGLTKLDPKKYTIVHDIKATDVAKFTEYENEPESGVGPIVD